MNLVRLTILAVSLLHLPKAAQAAPCTTIPFRVEGGSMSPRIAPGQMIYVREGEEECWGELKRGDVVLFRNGGSPFPLIKAIRGLPGDTLAMKEGAIIINGKPATNSAGEPYNLSPPRARMIGLYARDYHGIIPPKAFLVMGELTRGAADSSRFGLVLQSSILGKVIENPAAKHLSSRTRAGEDGSQHSERGNAGGERRIWSLLLQAEAV
jgi:signal peptidase I